MLSLGTCTIACSKNHTQKYLMCTLVNLLQVDPVSLGVELLSKLRGIRPQSAKDFPGSLACWITL